MPSTSAAPVVVVVGTGGTIAGTADDASRQLGYRAGALAIDELVAAVPPMMLLGAPVIAMPL